MQKLHFKFLTSITTKIPRRYHVITRALLCTPLALVLWASGANAVPIFSTQSPSVLLQADQTINGSFNLTDLAGSPYFSLNSATLTFYFSDDVDQELIGSSYGNYSLWNQSFFDRYLTNSYLRQVDKHYYDPFESVSVSSESSESANSTSSNTVYTSNQTGSQMFTGATSDGWVANPSAPGGYYNVTNYYYDQTTTHTTGNRGNLSLTLALGSSDLAAASSTGMLSYLATGLGGDLYFNSVRLSADISVLPPPVAEAVPEPSIVALLGLGITGLGIFSRRRK